MPVTIKTGPLRFKDPSSGQYVGIDVIAERKTSEQIAEIENVGAEALEEIGRAKEEALEEIREIVRQSRGTFAEEAQHELEPGEEEEPTEAE